MTNVLAQRPAPRTVAAGSIILVVIVLAGAIGLIGLLRAQSGDSGANADRNALPQLSPLGGDSPSLGQLHGGWISAAAPGLESVIRPLVAVAGGRDRTDILILDETGQSVVGSVSVVDEKPFVAIRDADRSILVSDAFSLDGVTTRTRLAAFDLRGQLTAKWVIELPERMSYTLYNSTAMQVSTDQRVLYYPALRREDIPACKETADAAICDRILVGVVDLEQPAVTALVDLGVGCGAPLLAADGARSVIATCSSTGVSYQIQPDGRSSALTASISHRYERLGVHGLPVATGRTPAGETYQVLDNGSGWIGNQPLSFELLSAPGRLLSSQAHQLADGLWLFGVLDSASPYPMSAILWDPTDPQVAKVVPFASAARGLVPTSDPTRFVVVTEDGRLTLYDSSTGEGTALALLPAGVKGLAN